MSFDTVVHFNFFEAGSHWSLAGSARLASHAHIFGAEETRTLVSELARQAPPLPTEPSLSSCKSSFSKQQQHQAIAYKALHTLFSGNNFNWLALGSNFRMPGFLIQYRFSGGHILNLFSSADFSDPVYIIVVTTTTIIMINHTSDPSKSKSKYNPNQSLFRSLGTRKSTIITFQIKCFL